MRARRRLVSPEAARAAGPAAAAHLGVAPEFQACRRVALYAALPDELPSLPLYAAARGAGKGLLWPRVRRDGGLEFAPCERWEELRSGRYGVLAPPSRYAATELGIGDLLLVPGLAFDSAGNRLGRGLGCYDRALAAAEGAIAFGVGFEFQRVASVPAGPRDRSVDAVLTESGLWRSARS